MAISPLPDPPSRADPQNFASRGDAFMAALPTFATEANALQADVNAKQIAADQAADIAIDQADIATSQAGIATTRAGEAAASASSALASKNAASVSESNAAASAVAAANSAASVDIANLSADYAGPDEPVIKWPFMKWGDTANMQLKRRNADNTDWVTLGPLFDFFYSRGSVVGTVAQSGGVPTGALFEYGSNINGEFWRFAGGLQLAKIRFTGYVADVSVSLPLPVGFAPAGLDVAVASVAATASWDYSHVTYRNNNGVIFSSPNTANNLVIILVVGRWF